MPQTLKDLTITIRADEKTCSVIDDHFLYEDLKQLCQFQTDNQAQDITITSGTTEKTLEKPARFGEILDIITDIVKKSKTAQTRMLKINGHTLDTHHATWSTSDGTNVRLTDKEADILIHLYQAKDKELSRDILLEKVWNYAKNVETHTLETHIYRLRRKIEENPTTPKILMTTETGYQLNDENSG